MILISLLPQSEDSKLKAIDLAYETRVAKIKQELQVISTLAQPKRADERFLPYLAHSHQVAFWSNDLTLDEKRAIIDFSIHLHRKKGTLFALKEVLKRLNIDVKFYEWFEYQGLPYHVKIDVDFPENVGEISVPPLLMVSFIENAFKHGISYQHDSFIKVSIKLDGNEMFFSCVNSKHATNTDSTSGIGLENVKKRLHLLFGSNYLLNIEDKDDVFKVLLVIPITI